MTDSSHLEDRLDQLGAELTQDRSVAESVLAELKPLPVQVQTGWNRARFAAVATVSAAVCILLVASLVLSRPSTLYAKAVKALNQVQTIHVTGWSTQVHRDWPLEEAQTTSSERQDVDMWFWRSVNGTTRGFERCGPVTKTLTGGSVEEYQKDVDLLYIAEGRNNDQAERFASLSRYLKELDHSDQEELGTKTVDGQLLRGVRVSHRNRVDEYWFDTVSELPFTFSRKQENGSGKTAFELRFHYDESVPTVVSSYSPPKAESVRYGGQHGNVNLAWKQHVQDLWQQGLPDADAIKVVDRSGRSFANQWPLETPDGKFRVVPIDLDQYQPLDIGHFIRLRVAKRDTDRDVTTWRVSEDLRDFEFPRCDLIHAESAPWQNWVQSFLNENGLEYQDVVEQRTYWIATHNGRKLRHWSKVKPPVPYEVRDGKPRIGIVRPGIGRSGSPETLSNLFHDFNTDQNSKYEATHPIIVDATGLPQAPEWDRNSLATWNEYRNEILESYLVASDSPYFSGKQSRQMARDWFKKEFGVTFEEEQRSMTIHVIKKK